MHYTIHELEFDQGLELLNNLTHLPQQHIDIICYNYMLMLYSLYFFGTIDELTVGSVLLVVIFGFISYKQNNPLFFKFQPVILGIVLGLVFLVMEVLNKPILVLMLNKYKYGFPEEAQQQLSNPFIQEALARTSFYLGWGLILHALLVAYAALKMSNWWWLIIRGIGFYLVLIACSVLGRFG